MTKDKNFFSKNKDILNTAGHAINALQNSQIRANQVKLARLSALNTAMQQEDLKLSKKKVELLEDDKKVKNGKNKSDKNEVHPAATAFGRPHQK